MPWGVAAAVAGAAVSSAMAPSTSGSSGYYTTGGMAGADSAWQNALAQEQSLIANQDPSYAANYQNAANSAGLGYGNTVNYLTSAANMDSSTASALLNAGQQVYQNSLDSNKALYNRSAQQLQDQTGATNSMYGLGSSAAGAGVANQAMSNFNIDWNTQQLQNQISGLSAYDSAASAANTLNNSGSALSAAIPGYQTQQGQSGYTAQQGILNNSLSQYQGIQNQANNYLGTAQGIQSTAYNNAASSAGALGSAVSSGVSGLGSLAQNSASSYSGGSGLNYTGSSTPYYSGSNTYGFTM